MNEKDIQMEKQQDLEMEDLMRRIDEKIVLLDQEEIEKEEKVDYTQLIAAQNEYARRLKIKSINRMLGQENKKKRTMAFISGICFSSAIVAIHASGLNNPEVVIEAINTEIQALSSFSALNDYLAMFSPATYGSLVLGSVSFSKYLKHRKNYKKANDEFYDMMASEPEDYLDVVERQIGR